MREFCVFKILLVLNGFSKLGFNVFSKLNFNGFSKLNFNGFNDSGFVILFFKWFCGCFFLFRKFFVIVLFVVLVFLNKCLKIIVV